MFIEIKENELPYIVAALGRVSEPGNLELYGRFYDIMTANEIAKYHEFYEIMEFTPPRW